MEDLVKFIANFKKTNSTGWRKWLLGSLVAVLSLVVVGVLTWQFASRAKQIADLKHDKDVALEAHHQATVDAQLTHDEHERDQHLEQAAQAMDRVASIDTQLTQIQEDHKRNEAIINSIQSWDDVDAHVK